MQTRVLIVLLVLPLTACNNGYDPLAGARAADKHPVHNVVTGVPPQCYTKTGATSNPCWVCHTTSHGNNLASDWYLQGTYDFSPQALTNHWANLFVDRRAGIARQSDASILKWVRQDNYTALRKAMARIDDFPGWKPKLHYEAGFDEQGFARDGSGWRAFRYKPFPGTFWPTNGSTDDVMIRLPRIYREAGDGTPSRAIYKINLAIVEAAVTVPDTVSDADLQRTVEPVNEALAGMDLNGDGRIGGTITHIHGLPAHYAGAARDKAVVRWQYPAHTQFLHTVHYLDPKAPGMKARRIKEVRYSRKGPVLTHNSIVSHYLDDAREGLTGARPRYTGNAFTGVSNDYGWTFQGYIENKQGRLRLQTREETLSCMGCHTGIGATVDGTFAMPRKLPGAAGWGMQRVTGQRDVPESDSSVPEYKLYLQRVHGGDEFRANKQMLARFFPDGRFDASAYTAAVDNPKGIMALIAPSRQRALKLDKAYRLVVRQQSYRLGRAAVLAPTRNVHRKLKNTATALKASSHIYKDGRLWLNWGWQPTDAGH